MRVEVAVLGFRPKEPYGFCGRKATLNHASALASLSLIIMSTDIRGHEALLDHSEPVWRRGKALGRKQRDLGSNPLRLS